MHVVGGGGGEGVVKMYRGLVYIYIYIYSQRLVQKGVGKMQHSHGYLT